MPAPSGESSDHRETELLVRPGGASPPIDAEQTSTAKRRSSSSDQLDTALPSAIHRPRELASDVSMGDSSLEPLPATVPVDRANPTALQEAQIRELLNRWGNAGFFRLKYMGEKIFIDGIANGAAHVVSLRTQYEERTIRQVEEPYGGGPVDDNRVAPDLWQVPVRPAAEFEQRVEKVVVPGTERVALCGGCAGNGRVVCPQCHGQGHRVCPHCGGTGVIEQQVAITGPGDPRNNSTTAPRVLRRRCHCGRGQVRCAACAGNGEQTCGRCRGTGRTKTFQQLQARYYLVESRQVLDDTPVADNKLGGLSGEQVFELKQPLVGSHRPVSEKVDQCIAAELKKSHAIDTRQQRVLMQSLGVTRIPQVEVQYTYAGVERRLWICGQEERVFARGAPWQRERYWLLVGGIVAAAAAVLGVLAFVLFR